MQVSISGLEAFSSVDELAIRYVTYNYSRNGATGTPPTGGTVIEGDTITLPAASAAGSRTGYNFSGWGVNNSTAKTHNASTKVAIPTNNTMIYAIWTPINYTILYSRGGGDWISDYTPSTTYNIESGVITLPTSANIARSGSIFLGWHEGSAAGTVVTSIPPGSTGNKTYYAEWGYTTAAYDAAVAAKQAIIDQLNNVTIPGLNEQITDLTKERNALKDVTVPGLNKQITDLTSERNGLQKQLDDKILEYDAQIEDLSDQIDDLNKEILRLNARITELEQELADCYVDRYNDGYSDGHTDGYGEGYDDGFGNYVKEYGFVTWKILQSDETIAGPLTTYDVYDNVKVSYDTQIQSVTLPEEKRIVYSKQYVYTFVGWSLTPQRGGTPNTPVILPKADATNVVYYAQYDCALRMYNIKWVVPIIDANGRLDYTVGPSQTTEVEYGWIIEVPSELRTLIPLYGNVNYIFDGWFSSSSGGSKIIFGIVTVAGAKTFYARYIMQPTV
jgi:uncharacterized repeat protein (TIGR02543 family)